MLWKDIKDLDTFDCVICPVYIEGICPGGYTSSPSGEPVEPPCCAFNDNDDLDEFIDNHYKRVALEEARLDAQYHKEQEKKRKADIANRRRQYMKIYCSAELAEVKRLKKKIKSTENLIDFAESMAFAFNTTNEMFKYKERYEANPKAKEILDELNAQLIIATEKLKAKQKECRQIERYKNIK